jgi:uracil-DNA glycosylase family 4
MPCNHAETSAFLDFVDRYLDAASYVPEGGNRLFPVMQLYGQATELALKAYLASTVGKWGMVHDLMLLLATAEKNGLAIADSQRDNIKKLNQVYYYSGAFDQKFPARYPRVGGAVWVTPGKRQLVEIVESIASQARDELAGIPSKADAPLAQLFSDGRGCDRCYPGQEIYVPQCDPNNSTGKSEVVFINERPGRIGTGKSGYVSFDNGDPTANFFRECFELAGLDRRSVFVTNACLCHPAFDGYKDKRPTVTELVNCHHWLRKQLETAKPLLIVTVGWKALESALRYFGHWPVRDRNTFGSWVGQLIEDNDPWIFPVAHTSDRGRANRKAAIQKEDWLKIPIILERARQLHE